MNDTDAQRQPPRAPEAESQPARLREVALLFTRLGFTAFGGPAAHIAMMRQEIVQRRRWISDARFADLLGIVNLIPGPNSTELAIYLGYLRAGWPGLMLAGVCFITPAMLIVLALAAAYASYGAAPQAMWLLYGIKPVVIAIVAQALYGLARTVLRGPLAVIVAPACVVLYLLGMNSLVLLFGGGLLFGALRFYSTRAERTRARPRPPGAADGEPSATADHPGHGSHPGPTGAAMLGAGASSLAGAVTVVPFHLLTLFLTFLKIGAVLYGSGYVLLAFLRDDFVLRLGWLTDRQLLDAISVGQFTPGPVFTTATFVGYIVGGWPGALVATLGIFLPSFVFIGLIHRVADTLRHSPLTAPILDGVNMAALALMAGVTLQLGHSALIDILTWAITLGALVILVRFKPNSAWLILAGALIGLAAKSLHLA